MTMYCNMEIDDEKEYIEKDLCLFIAVVECFLDELKVIRKRRYYRYYKRKFGDQLKRYNKRKQMKMKRIKLKTPVVIKFD